MIKFFTHTAEGQITGNGTCVAEYLEQQGLNGEIVKEGVADSRTQYLLGEELKTYTESELQAKNSLPRGWYWKMPERIAQDNRDIQYTKAQAWERIKEARTLAEIAPFTCAGYVYDANKEQILGAVQMALLAQMSNQPFSIDWTLEDNTVVSHNAQEMIDVGVALGLQVSSAYDVARLLRVAINNSTTNEEADAISWPT